MIIGACGFGSTGSSVVTDYLSEFNNIQVLDQMEFTWVTSVDGIVDLDRKLNSPVNRTQDSIVAIHRFNQLVNRSLRSYKRIGRINSDIFKTSAEKFIDSITQVKWDWYLPHTPSFFRTYFADLLMKSRVIPSIERQLGHRIKCWPMEDVSFAVCPKNFIEAARIHVHELIESLGADFSRPIALDQPFAGNNPQVCFKYFEDPYAIVVDRDPRDNYIFANTKLIGMQHFMPNQPVEDFVKYYRALRDNQPYKQPHARILSIKFEDMVYHYEETTERLCRFLHLPDNPNPKTVFDPAMSMANTQLWKRFPQYSKDVEYIERELSDYLFDYTGCPEPDANSQMFKGKSPKHPKRRK